MGGSFCPCTHFDKRAAKLYLVDSQLDTRLAIVHRKKEERPFFFFFFLPLFLRLKVAEDDKQQSKIYISEQRGPFSFLLDRGFVISRTLDVYLCGRDSPPPFYRLGKRWTTKNFDRPRSRNKITTNERESKSSTLATEKRKRVGGSESDNFDKFRTAFSLFVQIYYFDDKITTLERESKSLTFATEKRKRE